MTDRTSTDLRSTSAPALLVAVSGTLILVDRALDGPTQTVGIELLAAVLAATAWCGSGFGEAKRSVNDRQA